MLRHRPFFVLFLDDGGVRLHLGFGARVWPFFVVVGEVFVLRNWLWLNDL